MAVLGHRHSLRAPHSRATDDTLVSDDAPSNSSKGGTSSVLVAGLVIIGICVAMLLAILIAKWSKRRIAKKKAAISADETSY